MKNIKIDAYTGDPKENDKKSLVDGLLAYHTSKGYPRKTEVYSIFLRYEDEKTVGGIVVSFLWNGMHIDSLWIDESLRGQGWGTKLMREAESEGVRRGCTVAYTDTFTYQAPGFYEKLGYEVYGKLDDFPKGRDLIYYKKKLQ